jgi:hypothetical protein
MSQSKAEAVVVRLLSNAAGIQYGQVTVCLRIHNGRVVDVTYTTTESTKEAEKTKESEHTEVQHD